MRTLLIAFMVTAALGVEVASHAAVPVPVDATIPAPVVETWDVFEGLNAPPYGLAATDGLPGPTAGFTGRAEAGIVRVDVFRRADAQWHWVEAYLLPPSARLRRMPDVRSAVLVRRKGDREGYWWAEAGNTLEHVVLQRQRSIVVTGPDVPFVASVFSDGRIAPQVRHARGASLRIAHLPVQSLVVCATAADRSHCSVVPAAIDAVSLLPRAVDVDRLIATGDAVEVTASVKAEGMSVLRPKQIESSSQHAAGLLLVTLPSTEKTAVVDVQRKGCATERIALSALPPPPSLTALVPCRAPGVAIRPLLHGTEVPVEPGALVAATTAEAPAIALELAEVDAEGVSRFTSLGSGNYLFKLFSALSSGKVVASSIIGAGPASVSFGAGTLVTGKLRLAAGGAAAVSADVRAVRAADVPSGGTGAADLADWMRRGVVTPDGDFAIGINVPGPYTLQARWGRGLATRSFEMKAPPESIELGEIVLGQSPTVRGSVTGCGGGELRLIPLPDLAKPARLSLAELQRIPLDTDGRFYTDAVTPGQWMVSVQCAGTRMRIQPDRLVLHEAQEAIVDFVASGTTAASLGQ
ncbi:MAG TPA: hypothetical protein VF618_19065 [Thermoanaerobaculia bacterium]